ncbi:hypothetical protein [Methylobacterium sp. AMS5]|uniref:hypothetical protein n=1 Tax=Methylobacterium sp. AMS5 TaxID=925818 RepID=UPI00074F8E50|nr:hypothetical protein [Methylobacterium sp. AMS5]AMB48303.1 hypothetical protein Y590_25380 [Methylobacterium sp. AMS5]
MASGRYLTLDSDVHETTTRRNTVMKGEEILKELGINQGLRPQNELDPLQLVADLAEAAAQEILDNEPSTFFQQPQDRLEKLRKAQRLLTLNARHVPYVVDQVIDHARGLGGLKH